MEVRKKARKVNFVMDYNTFVYKYVCWLLVREFSIPPMVHALSM